MVVKVFNNIFFKHLLSLGRPAGAADRSYLPIAGGRTGRMRPRRNVTLLRAESLINDGTALVIYTPAVGFTVGEEHLTPLRRLIIDPFVLIGLEVQAAVRNLTNRGTAARRGPHRRRCMPSPGRLDLEDLRLSARACGVTGERHQGRQRLCRHLVRRSTPGYGLSSGPRSPVSGPLTLCCGRHHAQPYGRSGPRLLCTPAKAQEVIAEGDR
jgi:hypothetical protein